MQFKTITRVFKQVLTSMSQDGTEGSPVLGESVWALRFPNLAVPQNHLGAEFRNR